MNNDNLYSRMYIPTETKRRLLGELFEQFCDEHSLQDNLLKTIDQSEIWTCENHLKFLYVLLKITKVNLEYQSKLKEINQFLSSTISKDAQPTDFHDQNIL